jgi:Cu+-exporting ATPase
MNIETQKSSTCFHCGENCNSNLIFIKEKQFCCEGCKMVYELLSENNLCTFYDLNSNPGVSQKIKVRTDKFSFLEDEAVQSKLIQFTDGIQTHVTFYLPQMHCSSCLWLLENVHKILEGVVQSKVNFIKKEVFIVFSNNKTSLRKVVETLTAIGYEPHISLQELDSGKIKKTDHSRLFKVGIAGFCFANIMMMSFPEYLSSEGHVEKYISDTFRYLIVLFSLPVIFYCANEFFINAWKGLKNKFLNIDAPIALAILITFGRSIYEIFSQTGAGYLDSMSGIVFFMLLGRILQDKTYQSISFDRDYKSFFPIAVNVIKENKILPTTINNIVPGDIIQIYNNELIPVDGILSKGKASVDYSFVSGESLPVIKEIGEIIYAGGKQLEGLIELIVVKEVSQSYLTNLWNKDVFKNKNDNEYHSFIHVLSKYFTIIVLAIAFIAAAYWFSLHQYNKMWNTLTTVLIVACPCALLLSSTFTNGNILRILSKNKFYLRHPDVIENLTKINHLVFDKTGTITEQNNLRVNFEGRVLNEEDKINIASLMSQSSHPLSKAIVDYLETVKSYDITDFKITEGSGVEGWINEKYYKLGSHGFIYNKQQQTEEKNSNVYVMIDGVIAGNFKIVQKYRFGLKELIDQLKTKFPVSIISGDNNSEHQYLKMVFGNEADLLFHQKPEDKFAYVNHLQHIKNKNVLFIGDGLNDAGALKCSNVGITITENANNFTPACDGILDAAQFSNLYRFIQFAKAGKLIILISFVISVFYNIFGLYFAVQGSLSPLVAAILMPCSSVSIIFITYGLSELAAKKLHLNKHDKNHISS